jgi:hypothetical protein
MPLSRLFNTTADAIGAVDDLKLAGFSDDLIQVVAQGADYVSANSLLRKGIRSPNAEAAAAAVRAGATLLIIDAPLGSGAVAAQILEAPRPSDSGTPKAVYEGGSWSESTPVSSAFHIAVLSDNPSPLSDALSLPVLSKDQGANDWSLGAPTLVRNQNGPSRSLGFSTLTRNQRAPSKSLWFATLSKNQKGPSSTLGLPTLSRNQRGWASLLKNPAPLSSLLGLKLLKEG